MTLPDPANAAPETKPVRGWVWHSTDESIAAGQISVLSILETFCALGLYVWLAFHFEHQWWLLISAVAAPIILLRSPESKALGVQWLGNYWEQRDREWEDLSHWEKWLVVGIPLVVTSVLTWWLAGLWLTGQEGWELFWRSFALGTSAFAGVLVGTIAVTGEVAFMRGVVWATVAIVVAVASSSAGAGVVMGVLAVAMFGSVSKRLWLKIPANIIFFLYFSSVFALGIWLRGLIIRITATLLHPITGLQHLAENWHETIAVVDLTHSPELLPGATTVSSDFAVRIYLDNLKSFTDEHSWFSAIFVLVWYPPALLWRWSLKATLWLWLPLALLLHPPTRHTNLTRVRGTTVTQVSISTPLLLVATVVALWLASAHISPENLKWWLELLDESTQQWLTKLQTLAAPPDGLLEWALGWCCLMVFAVSSYAWHVKNQIGEILTNPNLPYELRDEPRQAFLAQTQRLTRLYTVLVVSFILLGYSVVLYLANHYYPAELAQFIPTWLMAWL